MRTSIDRRAGGAPAHDGPRRGRGLGGWMSFVSRARRPASARAGALVVLALVATSIAGLAAAPAGAAPTQARPVASIASPSVVYAGGLYVPGRADADAAASRAATADAAALRRISATPTAVWLGDWLTGVSLRTEATRHLAAARQQRATPVFVTYAVPNRDCGGHSSGGLTAEGYAAWNRDLAGALAGSGAVVIVEPDALAMLDDRACPGERARRVAALADAVDVLVGAGLVVYLDAGHSAWRTPTEMAALLDAVGVRRARGFATNVSNYRALPEERAYGDRLSALLGGARYVVDVSRNGTGWQGDWCNAPGASIGQTPAVTTGTTALDAVLWIKPPGQSDGTCHGGPPAGQWSDALALDLVRNSVRATGLSAEASYVCREACG